MPEKPATRPLAKTQNDAGKTLEPSAIESPNAEFDSERSLRDIKSSKPETVLIMLLL
jgi:hypothetical protein